MKKIIAFLCILTTLFSFTCLSTLAVVEYEPVNEGFFTAAVYFIEDRAFLIPQDKLIEAMTEDGTVIELPTETSGKILTIHCFKLYWGAVHSGPSHTLTTTIDNNNAITTQNYTFYFKSSESATYDSNLEIGFSDKFLHFWCYGTDKTILFLDKHEMNELINNKVLYLTNENLVYSERIYSHDLADYNSYYGGSLQTEVPKNQMLTFTFKFYTNENRDLSTPTENYKIYVNYKESFSEKFNNFINNFWGFIKMLMDIFMMIDI